MPRTMSSSSIAAARAVFRSAAARTSAPVRLAAGGYKARPSGLPFRIPKQALSRCIFRSPVELSCCVESMLPYHTATASALLTSKLSISHRTYGWTSDDCNDDV